MRKGKATEGLVQLSFRLVRRTRDENPVERNLRELLTVFSNTMGLS